MTTILWLKKPTVAPDLPRKHIIADAYAAMVPGEELWGKYLQEIERCRDIGEYSDEDYYFYRSSHFARAELMDITMGDAAAYVVGTAQQIKERVEQQIKSEPLALVDQEKSARIKAEQELEAQKNAQEKECVQREQKIEGLANRLASPLSWIVFAVFAIMVTLGGLATLGYVLSGVPAIVAQVIFVLLSIAGILFGLRITDLTRRLELWIARTITKILKGWLLP